MAAQVGAFPEISAGEEACVLDAARGVVRPCVEQDCPFWEPGGAVVEPGCALVRLGVDIERRVEALLRGRSSGLRSSLAELAAADLSD